MADNLVERLRNRVIWARDLSANITDTDCVTAADRIDLLESQLVYASECIEVLQARNAALEEAAKLNDPR